MRLACPTPFSGFQSLPDGGAVLSLSPERFVKVSERLVETRPIKGTRPRGLTPEEDAANAAELLASPKDRAENLMIVDLLRNDLGRTCRTGSVRVPELFSLESYPNVHHLVSSVVGTLADDKDALDLIAGSFPGGSITGAPKRQAMHHITALEAGPRGPAGEGHHQVQGHQGGVRVVHRGGRVLLIYVAIIAVVGWLYVRMPSSFLPQEDQGVLMTIVQLPNGATVTRTEEIIKKIEDFYLDKEKDAIQDVFSVSGFSFTFTVRMRLPSTSSDMSSSNRATRP